MCNGSPQDNGTINDLVERAFQYRGDVTVETVDDQPVTGYLFNRNERCSEPFVQLFEARNGGEITILYRAITQIRFTGRDAASASARHFADFQGQ